MAFVTGIEAARLGRGSCYERTTLPLVCRDALALPDRHRCHYSVHVGRLSWRLRSNGSDNDFTVFARGTKISSQIIARLIRLNPGQYQRPSALGARRPEVIDKFKIERVHEL